MASVKRAPCPVCKEPRKFTRQPANHVLHLLLTVALTSGLGLLIGPIGVAAGLCWVFVWMLTSAASTFHCDACGATESTGDTF